MRFPALDARDVALAKTRRYLPAEADVSNRFHVVIFGASGAFSVGGENGFDLLQLKLLPNGGIDVEWLIDLFAHEMHHSGLTVDDLMERWLDSNDPAEEIEEMARRDRDALKKEMDDKIRKAESEICHAGEDPLPITWTGDLWFGKPDGTGWTLGRTDVGGENQLQIKCP